MVLSESAPSHPELRKRHGVHYAVTNDGLELPVIDVTHPAFSLSVSSDEQRELVARFLREQEQFLKLPELVRRALMRVFLRGSILADAMRAGEGSFLTAISTYLLKLPPDMLGQAYSRRVDRKIATRVPALSIRLRMQDMARLAADAVSSALAAEPGRPLTFVNIAGGPALDNLNALLLLRRERPSLLDGRTIRIHVLDIDAAGPSFGARALSELKKPGSALSGLDVRFEYEHFDWSDASGLRSALERAAAEHALTLGTSEGGLFEYGSDPDILSVLSEFRDTARSLLGVVGSVTRDDELMRALKRASMSPTRPRGMQVFERLCRSVGYEMVRVIERPMSDDVLIRPA
jgi:hypothetical protein